METRSDKVVFTDVTGHNRPMIELDDVRSFVTIAEAGGVSAAARALDLPKSSISRSLSRLESALGVVLIERSTRVLCLSEAGKVFLAHSKRLLFEADEAESAIGRFSGTPRGLLRVRTSQTIAQRLVAPMLPAFLLKYPAVLIALNAESRRTGELADNADVLIKLGPNANAGETMTKLMSTALWTCVSPSYVRTHGTPSTVDALRHHVLIGVREQMRWTYADPKGVTQHVEFMPRAIVPEPSIAYGLIVDGVGIGRLPEYIAARAVASGELVRLFTDLTPEHVELFAIALRPKFEPAKVGVFIDALLKHLATR